MLCFNPLLTFYFKMFISTKAGIEALSTRIIYAVYYYYIIYRHINMVPISIQLSILSLYLPFNVDIAVNATEFYAIRVRYSTSITRRPLFITLAAWPPYKTNNTSKKFSCGNIFTSFNSYEVKVGII